MELKCCSLSDRLTHTLVCHWSWLWNQHWVCLQPWRIRSVRVSWCQINREEKQSCCSGKTWTKWCEKWLRRFRSVHTQCLRSWLVQRNLQRWLLRIVILLLFRLMLSDKHYSLCKHMENGLCHSLVWIWVEVDWNCCWSQVWGVCCWESGRTKCWLLLDQYWYCCCYWGWASFWYQTVK